MWQLKPGKGSDIWWVTEPRHPKFKGSNPTSKGRLILGRYWRKNTYVHYSVKGLIKHLLYKPHLRSSLMIAKNIFIVQASGQF